MRIDPIESPVVAAGLAQAHRPGAPTNPVVDGAVSSPYLREAEAAVSPKRSSTPSMPEHEVNVQVDDSLHRIYRFVDKQTGDLIQQVPPEELLRVMRNISEMLESYGENLNVNG